MPSIAPISKGLPVLEKATNFLSGQFLRWLQSVESRLNKAVVTDANGNIAYGGAIIPNDLNTDWIHYIYEGGHCKIVNKSNGVFFLTVNAYLTTLSGSWRAFNTGYSTLVYISTGFTEERMSTINVTTAGNDGDVVTWQKVKRLSRDAEGGANAYDLQIKTGSSIVAQL